MGALGHSSKLSALIILSASQVRTYAMPFSNLFHYRKPSPVYDPPPGPPPGRPGTYLPPPGPPPGHPTYLPPLGPPPGHPTYLPPPGPPPGLPSPPRSSYTPPPGPPPPSCYISCPTVQLPQYADIVASSHERGLLSDASSIDAAAAVRFFEPRVKRLQDKSNRAPEHVLETIRKEGCKAWTLEAPDSAKRWKGQIITNMRNPFCPRVVKVITRKGCKPTCLFSNLPMLVGAHLIPGDGPPPPESKGFYFEVKIHRMQGTKNVPSAIAIGTVCKPYPNWRFPGWNRRSIGLHLDDFRFFKDDDQGGTDYDPLSGDIQTLIRSRDLPYSHPLNTLPPDSPERTFGCGFNLTPEHNLSSGEVFFTRGGRRLIIPNQLGNDLRDKLVGGYKPQEMFTVFAAIGVDSAEGTCEFDVNFGTEDFLWIEGNKREWRVDNLVGTEELPAYAVEAT